MSGADWHIKGDYFETCNCDYLCPCIFTNMTAMPTDGICKVAIVLDIAEGHYGDVQLGGVTFVTAAMVAGPMGDGNWTVGLIIDDEASDSQVDAIGRICSGDEGGPMALMAPLIGTFAGIERAPIEIERRKMGFSITAGDLLSHGAEGVPSLPDPSETIMIDNTGPSGQQAPAPRHRDPQPPARLRHRLGRCGGRPQRPLRAVRLGSELVLPLLPLTAGVSGRKPRSASGRCARRRGRSHIPGATARR